MFFTSLEQRAASAAFDRFVESTDTALRRPAVVAELGGLASRLLAVNAQAFLPNRKNGQFVYPRRERQSDNLPLIPLSDEEAGRAYELIEPLQDQYVYTWPADRAVRSPKYGLELPAELSSLFTSGITPGAANEPTLKGLRSTTAARTQGSFGRSDDGEQYFAARPVITARASLLKGGGLACAAIIAHEEAHADDMLDDGPIYATLTYGGATELKGYHVGAAIYRTANEDSPESRTALWIDSIRRREIGNSPFPYTPDDYLLHEMAKVGIV